MIRRLVLALCLLLPALPGPLAAQAPPSPLDAVDRSAGRMAAVVERYAVDWQLTTRRYAVPMSPTSRAARATFLTGWRAALDGMPFDQLAAQDRVDWLLLSGRVDYERAALELTARRDGEVVPLLPFWKALVALEERRQAGLPPQPRAAAATLTHVKAQVDALTKDVERGRPAVARSLANRAAGRVDALRRALSGWFRFYAGYDPTFSWWLDQPYKALDGALAHYAGRIRAKLAKAEGDAVVGDPIGRDALQLALRREMIAYTPEELLAIAEHELAWCEAERLKAARALGFGDDWRKALEHVKDRHVAPGEQPALIRTLADEAVAFLDQRQLVTIPDLCRRSWRMSMMSPRRQLVTPYFTGGEVVTVAYPTSGMAHADKLMSLRGNNRHFSRAVVHHELIPGHHLQIFMAQRYRTHRSLFRTPFLVEGWALYWEMLLWDLDFARSDEDRLGMLFWRSHRCARILFSLGFHLGKLTPRQCIELLTRRVGHEVRNATAEVRRSFAGSYPPLYQAAYMLGGLQIRTLQRRLVGEGDGKLSYRQFHDRILRQGAIPIAMIRSVLEGRPLTRDYRPSWRFHDAVK